ncbi:MAG: HAD family phosphatase [Thermoguttaceae bacterium]|jgi:putative hydrolase of the HAD superfamily
MTPEFIYFDLGKVLVDFSIEQLCKQMGAVAGIEPARVAEAVFSGGLQAQYESGRISSREFYLAFGRLTGTRPDHDALARAANDIFTLNASLLPVVAQLGQAGYRLGVLSNTCEGHWEHCFRRYAILRQSFSVYALSYRIGACKPDAAIFRKAVEMAGCPPEEIFYTDDFPAHIAGARSVGIDAVQYTSTPELVAELRGRGVRFNY